MGGMSAGAALCVNASPSVHHVAPLAVGRPHACPAPSSRLPGPVVTCRLHLLAANSGTVVRSTGASDPWGKQPTAPTLPGLIPGAQSSDVS